MNENHGSSTGVTEEARPSAGQRLKEAREAQGLTREQVAMQLRLTSATVQALEEDDHDRLPPAAFVVGYLRSYARMLGLPEEELVREFEHSREVPPPLISRTGEDRQVGASDLPVQMTTYALVAGLLILLVLWWNSERGGEPEPQPEVTEQAPQEAPVPEQAAPEPVQPEQAEPSATVPQTEQEPAAPEAPQAPAEPQAQAEPEPEPEPAGPPPLTPDVPQARLTLNFQADSWAEVTDAAGRRLMYDLIRGGRVLQLRGEAPFSVFLGYAPGVSIEYQGEPYSFRARGDVARLRIGRPADNQPLQEE